VCCRIVLRPFRIVVDKMHGNCLLYAFFAGFYPSVSGLSALSDVIIGLVAVFGCVTITFKVASWATSNWFPIIRRGNSIEEVKELVKSKLCLSYVGGSLDTEGRHFPTSIEEVDGLLRFCACCLYEAVVVAYERKKITQKEAWEQLMDEWINQSPQDLRKTLKNYAEKVKQFRHGITKAHHRSEWKQNIYRGSNSCEFLSNIQWDFLSLTLHIGNNFATKKANKNGSISLRVSKTSRWMMIS